MISANSIITHIKAGLSVSEIAEDEGVTEGTLRNFMSLNNIRVRDIRVEAIREKMKND